jgi:HTH-type transcriptional regulator, quorum sensing regulator NprR
VFWYNSNEELRFMNIGEKIKSLRKAAGVTQQQLGGEQFTKGYISQIENGTVEPSMKVLSLIAERLGKPIAYFLDDDNYYKALEGKYVKAENQYIKGNYKEACDIFLEIAKELSGSAGVMYCDSLVYLGKGLFHLKDYNKSLTILNNSLEKLSEFLLFEKLVEGYLYIGRAYFELKQYDKAIVAFEEGLAVIRDRTLNLHSHAARFLLNIGTAYMNMGRLTKALGIFEQNAVFCKKELVMDTLLDCHIRMAYVNYKLNRIAEAKESIIKANSINCILEYDIIRIEIYSVLAMIIFREGNGQKAITLLNKSLEICRKVEYDWGLYVNTIDLITVLIDLGNLKEAEELINKYGEKIRNHEDSRLLHLLHGQWAKMYRLKNEIDKSISLYIDTINKCMELGMKWEVCNYSQELADILIEVNPTEAKKYYNISLKYLSEINN